MKIAIIGAGSAGLFAAKRLSKCKNATVDIFEKSAKVATKLRASGGGKANILNTCIQASHYGQPNFIKSILQNIDFQTIKKEFETMGLRMRDDEEGRVYPATFFAATVVDILLDGMSDNVRIHCETPVSSLQYKNGKWLINKQKDGFDKVILASGSPAGMIAKNRAGYNNYLTSLNLKSKELKPSLVGFKIKDYPRFLFGCKAKAEVSLWQGKKLIHREKGEVVFKEDGISGIVVLNCSAHYNRLKTQENCCLTLNFVYDDEKFDATAHIKRYGDLAGVLHPKLNRLFSQKPFDIRALRMDIKGVYDLEFAQVCCGGIDTKELGPHFEIKRHPGLYAIGEMLDVDGVCGGYNLFFAFASAYCVTENL